MRLNRLITANNVRAVKASARSPYPHMSVKDSKVWAAFLATRFVSFDEVEYDVALGGKAAHLVDPDEPDRPMWETLLKKRVDAVLFRETDIWCVEVKPLANMSSLGQCLSYAWLWNAEKQTPRVGVPVVVCSRIDADVEPIYLAYGALVIVVSVPDDGPPSIEKVLGSISRS